MKNTPSISFVFLRFLWFLTISSLLVVKVSADSIVLLKNHSLKEVPKTMMMEEEVEEEGKVTAAMLEQIFKGSTDDASSACEGFQTIVADFHVGVVSSTKVPSERERPPLSKKGRGEKRTGNKKSPAEGDDCFSISPAFLSSGSSLSVMGGDEEIVRRNNSFDSFLGVLRNKSPVPGGGLQISPSAVSFHASLLFMQKHPSYESLVGTAAMTEDQGSSMDGSSGSHFQPGVVGPIMSRNPSASTLLNDGFTTLSMQLSSVDAKGGVSFAVAQTAWNDLLRLIEQVKASPTFDKNITIRLEKAAQKAKSEMMAAANIADDESRADRSSRSMMNPANNEAYSSGITSSADLPRNAIAKAGKGAANLADALAKMSNGFWSVNHPYISGMIAELQRKSEAFEGRIELDCSLAQNSTTWKDDAEWISQQSKEVVSFIRFLSRSRAFIQGKEVINYSARWKAAATSNPDFWTSQVDDCERQVRESNSASLKKAWEEFILEITQVHNTQALQELQIAHQASTGLSIASAISQAQNVWSGFLQALYGSQSAASSTQSDSDDLLIAKAQEAAEAAWSAAALAVSSHDSWVDGEILRNAGDIAWGISLALSDSNLVAQEVESATASLLKIQNMSTESIGTVPEGHGCWSLASLQKLVEYLNTLDTRSVR